MKSVKSGMSRDFQKRYAPGPSLKRSFDNNNNNNNSSGNNDSKGDLRNNDDKDVILHLDFYKNFPDDFDDSDLS